MTNETKESKALARLQAADDRLRREKRRYLRDTSGMQMMRALTSGDDSALVRALADIAINSGTAAELATELAAYGDVDGGAE